MIFTIQIDKTNTVRIWDIENPNKNNLPFLIQEAWPNGTTWADSSEAENWANVLVESLKNPQSEFVIGVSKETHPMPRPPVLDPDTGLPVEPTDAKA